MKTYMYKTKMIAIILIALLALPLLVLPQQTAQAAVNNANSIFASTNTSMASFKDVKTSDWYYNTVILLVSKGVVGGYPDGSFKPSGTVQVDAFIKMMVTALGYTNIQNSAGYWAEGYINKAKEMKLVEESEFNSYTRPITRGEIARIIARALSNEQYSVNIYNYKDLLKDYEKIQTDSKVYVLKAFCKGIITGYPDGEFKESLNASRAEAATMIARFIEPSMRVPQTVQNPDGTQVSVKPEDLPYFAETGDPVPGETYKEYTWSGPYGNASLWQRVTDPEVKRADALAFLPNKVNKIVLGDLKGAVKAEMVIEMWGGHPGTTGRKAKINGNNWISIPELSSIGPGKPENYMQYRYPVIPIPLEQLKEGENTFEFTCRRVSGWGQWAFTGVVFRIYYPSTSKTDVSAKIKLPEGSKTDGEKLLLAIDTVDASKVKQVDYIGFYEDFDSDSDSVYSEWHYDYRYGKIKNHLGTSTQAPFAVEWDTSWIPDQDQPVKVMARITDMNGFVTMTPLSEDITLDRTTRSVKMYKPYDVPEEFSVRVKNKKYCKVNVTDDLARATDARMVLGTWSAAHEGEFGLNGQEIIDQLGFSHDISYDSVPVPINLIKQGENVFYIYSPTAEHAVEVMWPGIGMKVEYKK